MNMTPLLELLSLTAMKGAAVLLVALFLGLILRRMAAARRYALWVTAITALAVLPLAMVLLPAWRVLPKASAELEWPKPQAEQVGESVEPAELQPDGQVFLPAARAQTQAPVEAEIRQAISWQDVVSMLPLAWSVIAGCFLLRLGWSAWRLRRLESALRPGECGSFIKETARLLGLRRMPRLLIGPREAVPMVWGVLRPRLLLPQGFEDWSSEKQRGVLLHELAHLKRGDPLALWIAQWVKALHWFNPLAWLTLHHLRADQERACDDAVLCHGVRASDYAQSLLDLSRHQRLAPGLSLCALTITRCAPVESRVKAILDPKIHRDGLTLRWLAGLAACALLFTLPVAMLHAIESARLRGRILDRNGVVLAESTQEKARVYPLKTLAAQTIGYSVTRRTESDEQKHEGFMGVEKKQDAKLAAGEDETLALDMRIQSLVHQAMKDGGIERGAAVVLDPRTGEILAAVSLPSFDPNRFVQAMKAMKLEELDAKFKNRDRLTLNRFVQPEKLDALFKNRDRPTLNRCIRGIPPGSTFKILTGLAGEAAGLGDPKYDCTGTVTYGSKPMQCWIHTQNGGGHGVLGLSDSLAVSCNCYWYQFGNAAGIKQIESMGRRIGFGSAYGILEDEDKGLLPSPDLLKELRPFEKWSAGYTANTAIGQGFMMATPLQMAVLAATVGNGGKVPQPSLMKQNGPGSWREDLTQGTLTAAEVEPLREGMRLAVNSDSGTGKPARSDKVVIAGKTGTAQNWRNVNGEKVEDNHGWFIGFAPYENPQLAFAIVKSGAKTGGGDCGHIAKRIVEEALALPADGSGAVLPVGEELTPKQQAQAKFDAKADVIKAAIESIKLDDATGFQLDEIAVNKGQLLIRGSASGMIQALQFRDKVRALKFEDALEWTFPVPMTLKDGQRVGFRMVGVILWREKTTTALEGVKSSLVSLGKTNTEEGSKKTEVVPQPFQLIKKTAARLIKGSASPSSHRVVIDKGSLDGIVADSPVITSDGLVGKTATPEPHTTKVILLIDERCRVSARVEGTSEQGILNGENEAHEAHPQLHLHFLSRYAKIVMGSHVYSSGEGGLFPTGLPLGRVKLFKSGDVSGEAIVEPAVDFSALDQVFVIDRETPPPAGKSPATPKSANQAQLPISDDVIRMKPELAKQWAHLKTAGLLADLPAEAVVRVTNTERLQQYAPGEHAIFRFSLPQEAARRWLLDSVPGTQEKLEGVFTAANECKVMLLRLNDGTAQVTVFQSKLPPDYQKARRFEKMRPFRPILIAPDESREPRPAGQLAPEYHGKGFSQSQTRAALDVASSLRPAISPDEERSLLPLRFQTSEPAAFPMVTLPAPMELLKKDLGEKSQMALVFSYRQSQMRGYLSSHRNQQLFKEPQGL